MVFWVETEESLSRIKKQLDEHNKQGLNDIEALIEDVAFDLNCSESRVKAIINRMREAA